MFLNSDSDYLKEFSFAHHLTVARKKLPPVARVGLFFNMNLPFFDLNLDSKT